MRTKDIILSASLMAIYIAINILGSAAPIKVSSMMQSALFGMFWPYFSTMLNLTFQGLRVGYNLVEMIRSAPKIINMVKLQAIAGLGIFDWVYGQLGPIEKRGVELLLALSKIKGGSTFWLALTGYLILYSLIVPYVFYRYFKAIGLFRRLPSF